MKSITKKRTKAIIIDSVIASAVTAVIEPLLRKKIKNEFVHVVITPTVVFWGLEYAQLKSGRQTLGYKLQGLKLESESGAELTDKQIFKRLAYRDTKSTLDYLKNRKGFEIQEGASLPHDEYAQTVVRDVKAE